MKRHFVGLHGSGAAFAAARLADEHPHMTVVCPDRRSAEELYDDLRFFAAHRTVLHYPAWDTLPFEPVSPQIDISAQRLRVLQLLSERSPHIVITAIDALAQRVLPIRFVQERLLRLRAGDQIDRQELLEKLDDCGFQRVSLVEEVGQYAARGAVVDFYPSSSEKPVRIELNDGTAARLRLFETENQRSVEDLQEALLTPVRELVYLHQSSRFSPILQGAIERIKNRAREVEASLRDTGRIVEALAQGGLLPGLELLQAITLAPLAEYFDYAGDDETFIFRDEEAACRSIDTFWQTALQREQQYLDDGQILPLSTELYIPPQDLVAVLQRRSTIVFDQLEAPAVPGVEIRNLRASANIELITKLKTKVGSGKGFEPLAKIVNAWRKKGWRVAFVAGSSQRADRIQHILLDLDLYAEQDSRTGAQWASAGRRQPLVILQGHLSQGVQLPLEKLVFVAENEIFAERSYRRTAPAAQNLKRLLSSLAQLREGNFVVHEDYGIGIYRGLKHLSVEGIVGDFLHIDYADSRLYLPVAGIGKVQKFIAAEGQSPVLDRLGSRQWSKTKYKVKESIMALAGDLIKLYAARTIARGWRFEPAGAEDERFADGFAYQETPDQLAAIEKTLVDMHCDKPMDRLICGDVGFGKTEIALRAAFKCIQHTRQVAVLAPTTILVEQHKQSFMERFAEYPVKIAALSRFYKPAQNKETLLELERGDLDIVIGTHRILQRDVKIKDLGLLIIDEEHRFGVKQKERLKQLKKQVDVLTLTATPIPRTLHMALLDIRDISIISSPPHDRRAVRTYISTFSEASIRDAILRELQRGGQCFFVHNRVETIANAMERLQKIVPEAKLAFGHGQMSEAELEAIMMRFLLGEIDVLVCTTIIESGLDITNANTIIIDRADMFGLAQLYQLRGRVGRSNRQAYAYLIVPEFKKLGGDAQKRLKVLQSLDDLGMGFNLAIHDLEIRGAGNLLGKQQSGNVLAVGFDLYTKILKEAVLNLKGEEIPLEETLDPEVKLGIAAFIPEYYVPDIAERLVLYQRLAALRAECDADLLAEEIEDRFGPLPQEVLTYVALISFRCMLRRFGVEKAERAGDALILSFSARAPIDLSRVFELVKSQPDRFKFSKSISLTIRDIPQHCSSPSDLYDLTVAVLREIAADHTEQPVQMEVCAG